ncbi:hypothetical protein EBB07_08010 [Paenibacillaceae bacterium]|nr:hypothetical protein EBB07_08010 [Paenibacillaceae bacterium]
MGFYFQVCRTEPYMENYITFVLEHYRELNLPYAFSVSLSFLASPALTEGSAFLCFNEDDEIVGAFGYIRGTAEHQYEDTHVGQIQIAYLDERYRRSRLFAESLQYLVQHNANQLHPVQTFKFWVPSKLELHRLFSKLASREASWETAQGTIDEFHGQFADWQAYTERYRRHVYF